jgi:hypothetical protein
MSTGRQGYMLAVTENDGDGDGSCFMEAHEEAELRYWAERCGLCTDEFERVVCGNDIRPGRTSVPGERFLR